MIRRRIIGLVFSATTLFLIILGCSIATPQPGLAAQSAVGKQSVVTKQVKALKKRVKALEGRQTPTTLPPSGPAGGVLNGTYPNPTFAPGSVGTGEIADGAITAADLAGASINAPSLRSATSVVGNGVAVGVGQTKVATVSCPAGSRLLGGGFEWAERNGNGTAVISSSPTFTGDSNTTWEVAGRVDIGGTANTVFAEALCLN